MTFFTKVGLMKTQDQETAAHSGGLIYSTQFLINKKVNGLNEMYMATQQRISQQHSSLAADIRMLTLWGHRSKQAHVTHEIKYVQVAQSVVTAL